MDTNIKKIVKNTRKTSKWIIPSGCKLDKVISILNAIRQKNGDVGFIHLDAFSSSVSMHINFIRSNLKFLIAIKLVETDEKKNYKLTTIGVELIESWNRKDQNIDKNISKVIDSSHLVDLKDFLTNNETISGEKIILFIKNAAYIVDDKSGRPFTDINYQGMKAIIDLFIIANLLSDTQIKEYQEYQNSNKNKKNHQTSKKLNKSKHKKIQKNMSSSIYGHLSLSSGLELKLNSSNSIELSIEQLQKLLVETKKPKQTSD